MLSDVVVSGGGIGGAVLAELLARRGKRVVVLERNLKPPSFLRPEILWPATIDALCALHPRELWEREVALPLLGIRVRNGREPFAELGAEALRASGVQPWFVNPNDARELLLARASFELRRGVETVGVLREGGRPDGRIAGLRARDRATGVESDVPAATTVGDDGEHSLVRAGCGIHLTTRPFPLDFLCAGLAWPASFEPAVARVWINPAGRATGIAAFGSTPFVKGRGAGLAIVRSATFDAHPDVAGSWRAFLDLDPDLRALAGQLEFPGGLTRVRRSFGHALRYGAPGAFLIGDAAHPVTPAGGQGANMAVADALVLAPLIAGGAPDALRRYERARQDANARSVGISRNATRVLALPAGPAANAAFGLARALLGRPWLVARVLRFASQSFVGRG